MKKIRVLHCLSGLTGGTGKVVDNYFTNMNMEEYQVDIVAQGTAEQSVIEEYQKHGFNVIFIPSKAESMKKNIQCLYKLMKENNYDIVHAHMTLTNFFPLVVAKACGIKHRISHSHLADNNERGIKRVVNEILKGLSGIVATHYFACGSDAAQYLFGRKASKAKIINNAIDLELYKHNQEKRVKMREALNIAENEIVIGHVGRFTHQKNHDFIIEVFEKMYKESKNVKLVLVGNGERFEEVQAYVSNKEYKEHVLFLGQVDNVFDYLQAMDVFVLPSFLEGLCVAAIEAQANGIPCVFSDRVAKETRINSNVEFLSLDSADQWRDACFRKALEHKLEENSQLVSRGFDIKHEAKKLDIFYKSLVGECK